MEHDETSNHREHRVYVFINKTLCTLSSVNRKEFPLQIMRGERKKKLTAW
jgi:hypothetical protein